MRPTVICHMLASLDGRADHQAFVAFRDGLAGKVTLSFKSCEMLAQGLVHLRYAVARC